MNILVINCGSSSVKFQLIDSESEKLIAKGLCERIGIEGSRLVYTPAGGKKQITEAVMDDHKAAIGMVLKALTDPESGAVKDLSEIGAVGHRIVHGGENFSKATLITDEVKKAIADCSDLAPLHNPANLIGIEACEALMPSVPMVAVFDTAFHQTMPEECYLYAIPYRYYKDYRIRRYGFHGTSHEYVSRRAAAVLGKPVEELRIIVCHLGNGASVSAVKNGKCLDTSMGLTPLEGLVMGTRSGDIDPAIVEFIANKEGKSASEVLRILNKESGVYGVSDGFSSDFRDLEDAYEKGNEDAKRAMEVFIHSVVKYIGAYTAEMSGVDAICFTAGVGENSPVIRDRILKHLAYMNITIDETENHRRGEEVVISAPGPGPKVLVIPTNEELSIARQTYAIVAK
ncbi:MAG TPA: acetate kinase [Candidatus Eisenbergiella stercorigallinarum]|uniref:Acetate kinase n=1 Tax=Candidatus Eisenbergiella stercorigallinarum TaxID=2838557 RepID=A0A9D2QYS8_9FIRM|nr:acetate kinase [Candidatus Eisenbergiella stercorigallinarum]